jgi:hypothetical protein
MADPFELVSASPATEKRTRSGPAQSPRDYSTGPESRATDRAAVTCRPSPAAARYPEPVPLDFVLGLIAIVSAWMAAKRWSDGYRARYGRTPPGRWMVTQVDDGPLERERRILIVILVVAVLVTISVISRVYAPPV